MNIPSLFPDGAYLADSQGFVDRLIQDFAQNLGITLVMERICRATSIDVRKNRIPGMVYLTSLTMIPIPVIWLMLKTALDTGDKFSCVLYQTATIFYVILMEKYSELRLHSKQRPFFGSFLRQQTRLPE